VGHKWKRDENETLPLSISNPVRLARSVSENRQLRDRAVCAGNKKKQQKRPQTTQQ